MLSFATSDQAYFSPAVHPSYLVVLQITVITWFAILFNRCMAVTNGEVQSSKIIMNHDGFTRIEGFMVFFGDAAGLHIIHIS